MVHAVAMVVVWCLGNAHQVVRFRGSKICVRHDQVVGPQFPTAIGCIEAQQSPACVLASIHALDQFRLYIKG